MHTLAYAYKNEVYLGLYHPGISCAANLNITPQRLPKWDLNQQPPAPQGDVLPIRPLGPEYVSGAEWELECSTE